MPREDRSSMHAAVVPDHTQQASQESQSAEAAEKPGIVLTSLKGSSAGKGRHGEKWAEMVPEASRHNLVTCDQIPHHTPHSRCSRPLPGEIFRTSPPLKWTSPPLMHKRRCLYCFTTCSPTSCGCTPVVNIVAMCDFQALCSLILTFDLYINQWWGLCVLFFFLSQRIRRCSIVSCFGKDSAKENTLWFGHCVA